MKTTLEAMINPQGHTTFQTKTELHANTINPVKPFSDIEGSGNGICRLFVESAELLTQPLLASYQCQTTGAQIAWVEGKKELLTLKKRIDHAATLKGSLRWDPKTKRVSLFVNEWKSQFDLEAPYLVQAMELTAKSKGKAPTLKDGRVDVFPDGTIQFWIKDYHLIAETLLSSAFLTSAITSQITVDHAAASLSPDGQLTIISNHPKKKNFLTGLTLQPGIVQLKDGTTFPIDRGDLDIAQATYDPKLEEAKFEGHLHLLHTLTPNNYLPASIRIQSGSGRPQTFTVEIIATNWAISKKGVVEILSGEVKFSANESNLTKKKAPSPTCAPQGIAWVMPAPETIKKKPTPPSGIDFFSLAATFVRRVAAINTLNIHVPQVPGRVNYPLLGHLLSASLEGGQKIVWALAAMTRGSPTKMAGFYAGAVDTGVANDGQVRSVQACLNVSDHCITQPYVQFKGVSLTTEPEGARRPGEVNLQLNSFVQPNLASQVFDLVGMSIEEGEALGLRVSDHHWQFPLEWNRLRNLLAALLSHIGSKMTANPSLFTSQVPNPPSWVWDQATGAMDLTLEAGRQTIRIPGRSVTGKDSDNIDITLETTAGTHLAASRQDPNGPLSTGAIRFPFLGAKLAGQAYFAILKNFAVSEALVDLKKQEALFAFDIGEIPFRLGRPGGSLAWGGGFSNVQGYGTTFKQGEEIDPLDPLKKKYPTSFAKTKRLGFDFKFTKEGPLSTQKGLSFEGSPQMTGASATFFPHRLELKFDTVEDRTSYHGPHMGFEAISYRGRNSLMTAQLTDDIASGKVLASIEDLTVSGGTLLLSTGPLKIVGPGKIKQGRLSLENEQVKFSAKEIDITFAGIITDFIKRLGSFAGLQFHQVDLGPLRFKGEAYASSLQNGDVDLQGNIEITETQRQGKVSVSYSNGGFQVPLFQSPLSVHVGSLEQVKTENSELSKIRFQDLTLAFDNFEAILKIFDLMDIHLMPFDLAQIGKSKLIVHIGSGTMDLSSGRGDDPYLILDDISVSIEGQSTDSRITFPAGGREVAIHYPYLKGSLLTHASMIIDAKGNKIMTVDQAGGTVDFQKVRVSRQ
ncbi:MAG: hypothetical protein HY073_03630 [Deltaproteobacteria bacterium]|nr:hypothetical protein [Deltaproteobacteria bacterium]